MRVDGQSFGFFFKRIALRVRSADPHRDLHQHTLAAATHASVPMNVRGLRHIISLDQLYPAEADCRVTTRRCVLNRESANSFSVSPFASWIGGCSQLRWSIGT